MIEQQVGLGFRQSDPASSPPPPPHPHLSFSTAWPTGCLFSELERPGHLVLTRQILAQRINTETSEKYPKSEALPEFTPVTVGEASTFSRSKISSAMAFHGDGELTP